MENNSNDFKSCKMAKRVPKCQSCIKKRGGCEFVKKGKVATNDKEVLGKRKVIESQLLEMEDFRNKKHDVPEDPQRKGTVDWQDAKLDVKGLASYRVGGNNEKLVKRNRL